MVSMKCYLLCCDKGASLRILFLKVHSFFLLYRCFSIATLSFFTTPRGEKEGNGENVCQRPPTAGGGHLASTFSFKLSFLLSYRFRVATTFAW